MKPCVRAYGRRLCFPIGTDPHREVSSTDVEIDTISIPGSACRVTMELVDLLRRHFGGQGYGRNLDSEHMRSPIQSLEATVRWVTLARQYPGRSAHSFIADDPGFPWHVRSTAPSCSKRLFHAPDAVFGTSRWLSAHEGHASSENACKYQVIFQPANHKSGIQLRESL